MIKRITKISEEQLEQIVEIWLYSNIEVHDYIEENYWRKHIDFLREALPNASLFISTNENQQIVAFIGITDSYIAGLFVEKSYRHQGIGKKLIQAAKAENEMLILSVYQKNEDAIAFYQSQDFEIIEERLDEETKEIEYVMKWQQNIKGNST